MTLAASVMAQPPITRTIAFKTGGIVANPTVKWVNQHGVIVTFRYNPKKRRKICVIQSSWNTSRARP